MPNSGLVDLTVLMHNRENGFTPSCLLLYVQIVLNILNPGIIQVVLKLDAHNRISSCIALQDCKFSDK